MAARTQGVTIALIIFIVLTLIFGVLSYFMGQGYSETAQKLKEAEGQVQSATSENATLAKNFDSLKEKAGFAGFESSDATKILEEMDADIQKALADRSDLPQTYKGAVEELTKNLQAKNKELVDCKTERDKYLADMQEEVRKSERQKQEFDKARGDLETFFQTEKTKLEDNLKTVETNYQQLTKEMDDKKLAADQAIGDANQVKADSTEAVQKIVDINDELRAQLEQMNKLTGISPSELNDETRELLNNKVKMDFDLANGKVLYVDQSERTLRLNIGKADGVQPLTKFGVFPYDTLNVGGAFPKGSVEIIRVLNDHECVAKILTDQMTDPIMPGDLIYTPLWNTGDKRRYVLDCNLDLDGDGKSDLNTLVTMIRSSGAEVAGWIDDNGVVQSFDEDGDIVSQAILVEDNGDPTPIDITKNLQWVDANNNVVEYDPIVKPGVTALITNGVVNFNDKVAADVLSVSTQKRLLAAHDLFMMNARQSNVPQMNLTEFLRRISYKSTVEVEKYQEEGGLSQNTVGETAPVVSTAPVAPIYIPGKVDKAPASDGYVSPRYDNRKTDKIPASTGKVSDYYFRKRTP